MKWIWMIIPLLMIGCGETGSKKKNQNHQAETYSEKVYEFDWSRKLSSYPNKHIAVYGFVWLDTISPMLPAGNYTIYERPNCYQCGQMDIKVNTEISVVMIDDTTFENTNKNAQWRLVKVTGLADNNAYLNVERFERAEYCYPDYVNSGFKKLTRDYTLPQTGDLVYAEGTIDPEIIAYEDRMQMFRMNTKDFGTELLLCIKVGHLPSQATLNVSEFTRNSIRDIEGNYIGNKKVRVSGVLEYIKASTYLNVEAIEVIQ